MSTTRTFLGAPKSGHALLTPGHSTRFKSLLRAGGDGAKVWAINVATSDGSNNSLKLARAKAVTLAANMGTGTLVDGGGGSDTLVRSSGSFVTDGWLVGDTLQLIGATTLANDFSVILTGVSAGTLTFATATIDTAEALPSTAVLARLMRVGTVSVPLSSGYTTAAVAVSGLNVTQNPALDASPSRYMTLTEDEYLLCAAGTALGSSEVMDVIADYGEY